MGKTGKKMLCFACTAVLTVLTIFPSDAAGISDAKKKQQELENQMNQNQKKKSEKESEKNSVQSETDKLQSQLNTILNNIDSAKRQMDSKQSELLKTQKELAAAVETENKQYEDMKTRIKYMYEKGNTSFMEILFSASDIGDFLNKAEYISEISSYDRNMLENYQKARDAVAKKEKAVEQEYAELEKLEADLQNEQTSLANLVSQKSELLAKLESDISGLDRESAAYSAKVQEQKKLVSRLQQQEAEKQRKADEQRKQQVASANKKPSGSSGSQSGSTASPPPSKPSGGSTGGSSGGSGRYVWPLPSSRRITSYFGGRDSPTEGASSYHKGIDVGAPTGSSIIAAASGTVTVADSDPGGAEGKWVQISHPDGSATVYMHCSAVYVSVGQKVSRGQQIAAVGSTGISTGSHLHFGVMIGGSYVNPLNYL